MSNDCKDILMNVGKSLASLHIGNVMEADVLNKAQQTIDAAILDIFDVLCVCEHRRTPTMCSVFKTIMRDHGIPERNNIKLGPCYLDQPVVGETFHGVDMGLVFLNITVEAYGVNLGKPHVRTTAFTVFQRYVDSTKDFSLYVDESLLPMDSDRFFQGPTMFHNLQRLLSGQHVHFGDDDNNHITIERAC